MAVPITVGKPQPDFNPRAEAFSFGLGMATMKVRELTRLLQEFPDQDATVVIGEGIEHDLWLLVTGVVERKIGNPRDRLDSVGPGKEPGVEIV